VVVVVAGAGAMADIPGSLDGPELRMMTAGVRSSCIEHHEAGMGSNSPVAFMRRNIVAVLIAGTCLPALGAAQPSITVRDTTFSELFGLGGFKDYLIKVRLSAASSQTVSVVANVTGITAEKGVACGSTADFFGVQRTLSFPPNTMETTFALNICGDDVVEANETLKLTLSSPVNATIGPDATITIVDDDTPAPSRVFISGVAPVGPPVESAPNTLNPVFTVKLRPAATSNVEVKYRFVDETATRGSTCSGTTDYVGTSSSLLFAPGDTVKTITVPICNDTHIDAATERFHFKLTSATGAVLGAATANSGNMPTESGTSRSIDIYDDDKPMVTVSGAFVEPKGGPNPVPVTLTLNKPLSESVTFQYSTTLSGVPPFPATSGTACIGSTDYIAIPPTAVTFAPNEVTTTIPLTVCADTSIERDEQLTLQLETTPAGNVASGGAFKIVNINFPTVSVVDRNVEVSTDATPVDVGFTVTLAPRPGEPATVSYTTANGTLSGGPYCGGRGNAGYVATSGTLNFTGGGTDVPPPAGAVPGNFLTDHTQTRGFTVRICNRSTPSTQAVRILLTNAANAVIGDGAAVIKIVVP
jgi:Calx-beta domain-containing protein